MSREYDATAVPDVQVTVHWCPADAAHRLHVLAGARRGPGWYVFVIRGCLGRVVGPFENEAIAQYARQGFTAPSGLPITQRRE
jgi:hypothetical protein